MKNFASLLMLLISLNVLSNDKIGNLKIGDKAVHTDVKMLAVSGEKISLEDAKGENGILVLFSCNTCPFVAMWEDRYREAKKWADKNSVGMIVLNSNFQKRNGVESYEEMKQHAGDKDYTFHYVVDKHSLLANAFGGKTTPHVFLFDGDMKLAYKGAIDDNSKSATDVEKSYLKDAITSLGKGAKIMVSETSPVGCGIKRKID